MLSTGITRKVDELGRIVIPKELRRNFGIEEKDSLEIFTEGDNIVLRKYEPVSEGKIRTQLELEKLLTELSTEEQKRVVEDAIKLLKGHQM
ncbi:AbrB/MazE/SpoVT family DNA-binding domain-containing protein [Lysinibacillus sp. CD3-6]|uniref:AbrB/MazE/SpoVT family DNA-binding domain-containing protein n=1 Tax=Lysinibacillus sp. CD3-6 TaxID=2892541 RepID=UPI00111EA693|nr:AbrB/MazE/SpoVT family DNA-binding domain-containing protein [Lysinibacillus sp. CD3-6]UED81915.1 AbrB/MazE/SpoVT family DNA-binding domain-containing protein [Lysinibacillus sp. CD3-6]